AALDEGDGRAPRRPRPRPAGRGADADPRAGGGDPALRRGDGADAARPRGARPRGLRLPTDRADRDAGGTGDAPGADRGAPRRAPAGGAAPAPGRRRAREDLHEARARRPELAVGVGARAAPDLARAQGGAERARPTAPAPARLVGPP